MGSTITIISAIVGAIMLIVFFVMAYNLSKIKNHVRQTKMNALRLAFIEGKAKKITCNNCKKEYIYLADEYAECPYCFMLTEIKGK